MREGILIIILFKIIITLMSFLFLSRFFQSLHVIKKSCSVQGTYKRKMSTVSSTASNAGRTYRSARATKYMVIPDAGKIVVGKRLVSFARRMEMTAIY